MPESEGDAWDCPAKFRLCAIDPKPRMVDTPEIIGMIKLFAELIAIHLDAYSKLETTQAALSQERDAADLREQFIAVLGHNLRNPLTSISAGAATLVRHPERGIETAMLMQQSVSRVTRLIDNVPDLARGRLGGGLPITRDADGPVEPMLRQVVDELQSIHPHRVIEVDFTLDESVSCDRSARGADQSLRRDEPGSFRALGDQWRRSHTGLRLGLAVSAILSRRRRAQPQGPWTRSLYRERDSACPQRCAGREINAG
jgi:signal transduction histidine kinase